MSVPNEVRISGIPTEVANRIRKQMRDDFGHELRIQIVDGAAPCRHCLRIAQAGERMILFSYRPFAEDRGPYSEIGPVFVHADPCSRYSETSLPPDYADRELVVRAYDAADTIAESVIVPARQAVAHASSFLQDPRVQYVHARHPAYGCYAFRIERSMT